METEVIVLLLANIGASCGAALVTANGIADIRERVSRLEALVGVGVLPHAG